MTNRLLRAIQLNMNRKIQDHLKHLNLESILTLFEVNSCLIEAHSNKTYMYVGSKWFCGPFDRLLV